MKNTKENLIMAVSICVVAVLAFALPFFIEIMSNLVANGR